VVRRIGGALGTFPGAKLDQTFQLTEVCINECELLVVRPLCGALLGPSGPVLVGPFWALVRALPFCLGSFWDRVGLAVLPRGCDKVTSVLVLLGCN
jgi:hypothetical protein